MTKLGRELAVTEHCSLPGTGSSHVSVPMILPQGRSMTHVTKEQLEAQLHDLSKITPAGSGNAGIGRHSDLCCVMTQHHSLVLI